MIRRYRLIGGDHETIVIKHVKLPEQQQHPKGWHTRLSHQRKIQSYHVETNWYRHWSALCEDPCRVPSCYTLDEHDNEFLMVLEDLDLKGYHLRKHKVSKSDIHACLNWLAHFHATFMDAKPKGLWPIGTYWHLDTRPDELEQLSDQALRQAAPEIDRQLNSARFKTLVHGDAKLANFCFTECGQVAAVDFQYVGGGCGMKDVAYLIGSCLSENDCERMEGQLLDHYFSTLKSALVVQGKAIDLFELESEWRALFPLAWTDFHRFLKGWSPAHWKINSYSEKLAQSTLKKLHNTTA